MAGVKNRLQMFEAKDPAASMPVGQVPKPGVSPKPPLTAAKPPVTTAKPLNPALLKRIQQNKGADQTDSEPSARGISAGGDGQSKQDHNQNSVIKESAECVKPSEILASAKDRRVSVPKIFQQEAGADKTGSAGVASKVNGLVNTPLRAINTNKDREAQKPPSGDSQKTPPKPPPAGAKPTAISAKPPLVPPKFQTTAKSNSHAQQDAVSTDSQKPKPLALPKPSINKSNGSNSSLTTSSPISPTTTLSKFKRSPSPVNSDKNAHDFRSHLRHVSSSSSHQPKKTIFSPATTSSSPTPSAQSASASSSPPTSSENDTAEATPPATSEKAAEGNDASDIQLRKKSADSSPKQRTSSVTISRNSDCKRFKKIHFEKMEHDSLPPPKPELLENVDLTKIREQYLQYQLTFQKESDKSNKENPDEESQEELKHKDSSSEQSVLPRRSLYNRKSERISLIPDMSPEDEGLVEDDEAVYDDGFTPFYPDVAIPESTPKETEDLYIDAETEKAMEVQEADDIYEDGESVLQPNPVASETASAGESEQDRKKRLKEEAEAKKKEEREKKEREKKEREEEKRKKKEEQEKLKKEREEEKLREKFKLTGNKDSDVKVGEGVIKADARGRGLNLPVKKGQMVIIIRMENNPSNKWLVKTDTGMGYVDIQNIDVDPNIIKQYTAGNVTSLKSKDGDTMKEVRKTSTVSNPESDDQPIYDAVPEDMAAPEDEMDDEDIYEECP